MTLHGDGGMVCGSSFQVTPISAGNKKQRQKKKMGRKNWVEEEKVQSSGLETKCIRFAMIGFFQPSIHL